MKNYISNLISSPPNGERYISISFQAEWKISKFNGNGIWLNIPFNFKSKFHFISSSPNGEQYIFISFQVEWNISNWMEMEYDEIFYFLSSWMEYDRGEGFSFDLEKNRIQFGSKRRSYSIQFEWKRSVCIRSGPCPS